MPQGTPSTTCHDVASLKSLDSLQPELDAMHLIEAASLLTPMEYDTLVLQPIMSFVKDCGASICLAGAAQINA
jgi:hypothetical protein